MVRQKQRSVVAQVMKSRALAFSKTELKVISELGKGNKEVATIAKALNLSASQVYRTAEKLHQKGILSLSNSVLQPEMKTHVNMLLKLLMRANNLSIPLSGTGLKIFMVVTEPKTIKEVERETNFHKTTILKKITQGRKMSLLLIQNKTYRINEKIWSDAEECLVELRKYEESVDRRVPVNSEIYFKNNDEIIFSNKEAVDAEKTAFSAYKNYGIKLLLITNYYYLPKRKLSKKEVFLHSLYVADKSKDTRDLIFVALFYTRYKRALRNTNHKVLDNLNKIFLGEKIPGYPTLQEMKDRAEVYGIRV